MPEPAVLPEIRKSAFLSHSSADKHLADALRQSLEQRGATCWIAPRDVRPGAPYAAEIVDAIERTDYLVLLASEAAVSSVQVKSEVHQAHVRGHPICTLLLPPVRIRGELDYYLSRYHWLNCEHLDVDSLAEKLAPVLLQSGSWDEIAEPPSFKRTVFYRPAAFAKLVSAMALAVVLIAAAAWLFLANDYTNLGYVAVNGLELQPEGSIKAHIEAWLLADNRDFSQVTLTLSCQEKPVAWSIPDARVHQEVDVTFAKTEKVATCLVIPSKLWHRKYRVTQWFRLLAQNQSFQAAEIGGKHVSPEDGSKCGQGVNGTL